MTAAAAVAVASTGAIPQLGFVHEDSGQSFVLDIADLYRHDVLLDIAFGAVRRRGRMVPPRSNGWCASARPCCSGSAASFPA